MRILPILVGIAFSAVSAVTHIPTACASVYVFNGNGGNTNVPYAFGNLPGGSSTFSVTNNDYIPYPVGSNHSDSNAFIFSLTAASLVSVTFSSGPQAQPVYVNLEYSPSNPLFNPCCLLFAGYSNGFSNQALAAGSYAIGLEFEIPSAPTGTAPYLSETYSGSITATSSVPETSTWAMMLIGFVGLGVAGYRRTRHSAWAFAGDR
jgi:hypothetical protein